MRILFAGTPDFSASILKILLMQADLQCVGVLTQADKPRHRGQKLQGSPVKLLAQSHNIPVASPAKLDQATWGTLNGWQADVMVVVAYGKKLPASFLNMTRFGCVNIHASLLPRWRGAAPIHHALLAGDSQTGISLMKMNEAMDEGDVFMQESFPILESDHFASVESKLQALSQTMIVDYLKQIKALGQPLSAKSQDHNQATFAPKIQASQAWIHWNQDAQTVLHHIQAFSPKPGAKTQMNGKTLMIKAAHLVPSTHSHPAGTLVALNPKSFIIACQDDCISVDICQLPGKSLMNCQAFCCGYQKKWHIGDRFTSPEPATTSPLASIKGTAHDRN